MAKKKKKKKIIYNHCIEGRKGNIFCKIERILNKEKN